MENGLAKKSELIIRKQFEEQEMLWFPVMMGIATKAEMDKATMAEIQLLNEVANKKLELQRGLGLNGE
ncbi:MAG: hypothetical protein MRZ40_05845 [Ligilactobacillus animalis]|uniref:hypothetical protein n=1 Tax=Ligilactobacillus TaxID=2767887 RepID=UPI0012982552|nr:MULTISPECIES: hypothetical protein [Ligilactobacillus]MCI5942077.1 hypothetical protein [Ligilactobacillus animalis]MDO4458093.1 hypothetical protein [Ligilactobacillus murinus]MDY2993392.1 hypothetical protein [Ligilactobacillus animalis]WOY88188.1 hypothetical protein R7892_05685 [Ligilactobacillus murinus]